MAKELKITITGPSLKGMSQNEQTEFVLDLLQAVKEEAADDEREGTVSVMDFDGAHSCYDWKVEEVEAAE